MTVLTSFFADRRGVGAIDYGFLVLLMIGVRGLAEAYGGPAGVTIKQAFGVA